MNYSEKLENVLDDSLYMKLILNICDYDTPEFPFKDIKTFDILRNSLEFNLDSFLKNQYIDDILSIFRNDDKLREDVNRYLRNQLQ